jgi:hypothetical protein
VYLHSLATLIIRRGEPKKLLIGSNEPSTAGTETDEMFMVIRLEKRRKS